MATTATPAPSLENVTTALQAKNAELNQLQNKLQQAVRVVNELNSTRKELEVGVATEQAGAGDRLRSLLFELQIAVGRQAGLELLISQLQPALEELRTQWSTLKRTAQLQQRDLEIQQCEEQVAALDHDIYEHQALIDRLLTARQQVQERKNALHRQ